MDWFLYDNGLSHERVKLNVKVMKITLTKLEFLKLILLKMYIEDKEKRFSVLQQ